MEAERENTSITSGLVLCDLLEQKIFKNTHTHKKNTAECFTGRFLVYYFSSRQRVLTRKWSQHDGAVLCFHFLNVGLIAVFVRWQIFRIISKSPLFIFVGKNKCAASIQWWLGHEPRRKFKPFFFFFLLILICIRSGGVNLEFGVLKSRI